MSRFRRIEDIERELAEAREQADIERRDRALQVTSLQVDLRRTQEDLHRAQLAFRRQRELAV